MLEPTLDDLLAALDWRLPDGLLPLALTDAFQRLTLANPDDLS